MIFNALAFSFSSIQLLCSKPVPETQSIMTDEPFSLGDSMKCNYGDLTLLNQYGVLRWKTREENSWHTIKISNGGKLTRPLKYGSGFRCQNYEQCPHRVDPNTGKTLATCAAPPKSVGTLISRANPYVKYSA